MSTRIVQYSFLIEDTCKRKRSVKDPTIPTQFSPWQSEQHIHTYTHSPTFMLLMFASVVLQHIPLCLVIQVIDIFGIYNLRKTGIKINMVRSCFSLVVHDCKNRTKRLVDVVVIYLGQQRYSVFPSLSLFLSLSFLLSLSPSNPLFLRFSYDSLAGRAATLKLLNLCLDPHITFFWY